MDLFNYDIVQLTVIELAIWVLKCRTYVSTNLKQNSTYDIKQFCEKWEDHYINNEDFYKGDKYRKAVILAGRIPKHKFVIDFKHGTKNVTDILIFDSPKTSIERKFYNIAISTLNDDLDLFKYTFDECFKDGNTYKNKLFEIISEQYFIQPYVRIRVFVDGKWLKANNYAEFLKKCEDIKNYEIKHEIRKTNKSYITSLKEFGIPKTVYFDFMNTTTCEKEFDKKLFVNLGLALSLPYTYVNKLFKFNGLAFKDSTRQFDNICEKGFRIGYCRNYLIALIDMYNDEKMKQFSDFVKVPNL